jgi:hypothetical protein
VGIEMDDADGSRVADLGDRRGRRPGDGMIAAEDDRDGAGLGHLPDLAIDHRVATLDPGRDDIRVAGIDDGEDVIGLDVELERVDRARGVLGLANRARPETCARPMRDGVVERGPDDRHVNAPAPQFGRVCHPRQLHERGRSDIRGQIEIVECVPRLVPAVAGREVALGVSV